MSLSCRPEAFFFFPKKNKKHKHKQKQKQKQKNIKKKNTKLYGFPPAYSNS